MDNNLLWQYLSAAGMDIGAGKPIGANVNAVTQQQISSRNYVKLLQKLLENGGKMNIDKDNFSIKAPTNALGGSGGSPASQEMQDMADALSGGPMEGGSGPIPKVQAPSTTNNNSMNTDLVKLLMGGSLGSINPSASPLGDLSGADLAGLTPNDISQALQFKFTKDELERRSIGEVLDYDAKMAKLSKEKETNDITNYEYAVARGYTGSFEEFRRSTDTSKYNDYLKVKSEGYKGSYQDWLVEMATLARPHTEINIGDKVETKKALAKVEGQTHFTSGEFTKDVEKFKSSDEYQNMLFKASIGGGDKGQAATTALGNYVQNLIESKGGNVQRVEWDQDGKTAVWTVKWESGDTTKVRYRVRD
jgi:hypothetical protein